MIKDGFYFHLTNLSGYPCILSSMSDPCRGENRLALIKVNPKKIGDIIMKGNLAFLRTRTVPQLVCDGRFYRGYNMKVMMIVIVII